jgi:FkbM family methyltransferase
VKLEGRISNSTQARHAAAALPPARRLLTWPLRFYVSKAPWRRAKNFVQRRLLPPLLPSAPASFVHVLPGGALVRLRYREFLGVETLIHGDFEGEEVKVLCARAEPNSTAVDVGANVGYFTVAFARAVGPCGRVIAVEPYPPTVARLRENLELNHFDNVDVLDCAAGSSDGSIELALAGDPSICTTITRPGATTVSVRCVQLDNVWKDAGRPHVSVLKVDAEGAETAVLEGARTLLAVCRPTLVLEANSPDQREALERQLESLGYERQQPSGFRRWSYLFEVEESARRPSTLSGGSAGIQFSETESPDPASDPRGKTTTTAD